MSHMALQMQHQASFQNARMLHAARSYYHQPHHFQNTSPGYQGNGMNVNLDGGWQNPWRRPGHYSTQRQGYVLDTNRNGRYDKGRDGVLAFDMNGDGRIDRKDVNSTNDMMQAATGNFDLNGDGRVGFGEYFKGRSLQARYRGMDRNRDGILSAHEMNNAGGKVWIDSSRGGGVGRNELHSVFNMPNSRGWGPSQRLDAVNPFQRASHTSNNHFWGGHNHFYNQNMMYAGGTPGFYG